MIQPVDLVRTRINSILENRDGALFVISRFGDNEGSIRIWRVRPELNT